MTFSFYRTLAKDLLTFLVMVYTALDLLRMIIMSEVYSSKIKSLVH